MEAQVKAKLETLQLRGWHGNHRPERRSEHLFLSGF